MTTPATLRTTRVLVPASPDGPAVPTILHDPGDSAESGWIVWAHGGSWHQGSAADWQHATAALATLTGWRVLSLDYRLAPHHRHPASVSDMLTALIWLRQAHPHAPIIVGGDSAGGTLAADAALAARDRGLALQAQLLAYPPIDPACCADSYYCNPLAFPSAEALRTAWHAWQEHRPEATLAADGTRLLATPALADSLVGLCRTVLVVGSRDPVRDDVAGYAANLRAAGVAVDHRVLPGIGHGDVLRPESAIIDALAAAVTHSHRPITQ